MNIAESARFNALKALVESMQKIQNDQAHEIANLKQVVEILTTAKDSVTLRIKKSA